MQLKRPSFAFVLLQSQSQTEQPGDQKSKRPAKISFAQELARYEKSKRQRQKRERHLAPIDVERLEVFVAEGVEDLNNAKTEFTKQLDKPKR